MPVQVPPGRNWMNAKQMAATGLALVATAVPATALAAEQAATPPAKTATPIGKVHSSGATATLKVKYSCKTGTALWVSLKQSKSGKKDKALKGEGSSKAAHSWLQSHAGKVTCDGKKHTATFTVD